jgi:hypothetical protein
VQNRSSEGSQRPDENGATKPVQNGDALKSHLAHADKAIRFVTEAVEYLAPQDTKEEAVTCLANSVKTFCSDGAEQLSLHR